MKAPRLLAPGSVLIVAAALFLTLRSDVQGSAPATAPRVEALDPGAPRPHGSGYGPDGGVRLFVPAEGRYRVELPEIPGYQPMPPLEVEVDDGPAPDLRVALVRRV